MTDHEKRIREALEAGPTSALYTHPRDDNMWMQNEAFATACNPATIRALLADLDEARSALTAAQERLGAYGMLSGPPQTLAQVAYYLRKWTPSIERKYAGDANRPDMRYVVKLLEHIAKGASHE